MRQSMHTPTGFRPLAQHAYPNGVSPVSPGLVAIGDLPWVEAQIEWFLPQRGCANSGAKLTQPRWGRGCSRIVLPRVAAYGVQPWAKGRNAVGVQGSRRASAVAASCGPLAQGRPGEVCLVA